MTLIMSLLEMEDDTLCSGDCSWLELAESSPENVITPATCMESHKYNKNLLHQNQLWELEKSIMKWLKRIIRIYIKPHKMHCDIIFIIEKLTD